MPRNIPLPVEDVTSSQLNLVADEEVILEDVLDTTLGTNSPVRLKVFSCFIGRFPFVREVVHQDFSDLESDLQELSL